MNERGFSMIEAMVAMGILSIMLVGMVPSFYYYNHANTHAAVRTDAVTVAQQLLDEYRQESPASMPTSGSTTSNMVADNRNFSVNTIYCSDPTYCGPNTRHITIEVSYGGQPVYRAETVYTQLH